MSHVTFQVRLFAGILLLTTLSLLAQAQTAQTFVSARTGVDGGICSLSVPCRTITYAFSQVAAGGEINLIDSGDYDTSTIDRSVTIQAAPGVTASIRTVSPASGIFVSTEATEVVTIRGLTISGAGSNGLLLTGSGTVNVDSCRLFNLLRGFRVTMSGQLSISNTVIQNCDTGLLTTGITGSLKLSMDRCQILKSASTGINLSVGDNSTLKVVLTNTRSEGHGGAGLRAIAALADSSLFVLLENCVLAYNQIGIHSERRGTLIRVSNSAITHNDSGIALVNSGLVVTRGNNTVEDNNINSSFSGTFAAK